MDNVSIIEYDEIEYVIIAGTNDEYTSMTKAEYDRRQAEAALSTPNV
jgi:hypothetical protein